MDLNLLGLHGRRLYQLSSSAIGRIDGGAY
jgi:hypothetical protein